jgi:hypothetical protein
LSKVARRGLFACNVGVHGGSATTVRGSVICSAP